MSDTWITTYSGKHFYPLEPNPSDISIDDIANALSNISRFNGHCQNFYSVAQHCVLVSQHCLPDNALYGLLHDASEGLSLSDLPTQIKRLPGFERYREIERNIQAMVYSKFGLSGSIEPQDVIDADQRLLATEMRDLMNPAALKWKNTESALDFKIEPLPPTKAKELFLNRFYELTGSKYVEQRPI